MGEVLIGIVLFLIGIVVGSLGTRSRVKDWLEENGCYNCQEKYRNRIF